MPVWGLAVGVLGPSLGFRGWGQFWGFRVRGLGQGLGPV